MPAFSATGHGSAEHAGLPVVDDLLGGFAIGQPRRRAVVVHRQRHDVARSRIVAGQELLEVSEMVRVMDAHQDAVRSDAERRGRQVVPAVQSEAVCALVPFQGAAAVVAALADAEQDEEHEREADAADGGRLLREEVHAGEQKQHRGDQHQAERQLRPAQPEVERDAPALGIGTGEPEHGHAEGLHREAPRDAERVSLAEQRHVAPADDDRRDLQDGDRGDQPVGGPVLPLRLAEPLRQDPVLGDPLSTPLEPMIDVFTAADRISTPTATTTH